MSLRSVARFGDSVSLTGPLRVSGSYVRYDSSKMEFYNTNKAMSVTTDGGTLHGIWTAEATITSSDRRLKRNIAPLYRSLLSRMPDSADAADSRGDPDATDGTQDGADASTSGRPLRGTSGAAHSDLLGSAKQEGKQKTQTTRSKTVNWVLRELRPVSFEFKSGPESKYARYGFVAQELERVLPNVVRNQEQYKYVVYQDLIAVLVLAAQTQEDTIRKLQEQLAKVAALQLAMMERLNQLEVQKHKREDDNLYSARHAV